MRLKVSYLTLMIQKDLKNISFCSVYWILTVLKPFGGKKTALIKSDSFLDISEVARWPFVRRFKALGNIGLSNL